MKWLFTGFLMLVLSLISSGLQAGAGDLQWQDHVDGQLVGISAGEGHVYVAGHGNDRNGDFLVRAYNAHTGAVVWEDLFDEAGLSDQALRLTQADGLVFAVGSSGHDWINDTSDFLVRAYDARTGKFIWMAQAGDGHLNVATNVMAVSGRVVAAGFNGSAVDGFESLLRAYDTRNGYLLWEQRLGKMPREMRRKPTRLPSTPIPLSGEGNRVFAAGSATGPWGGPGSLVRAYDAGTGELLWEKHFDVNGRAELASALTVAAGRVFAVSRSPNDAGHDTLRVRTFKAGTGALLWQTRIEDLTGDAAPISVSASGNSVFIAGYLCKPSSGCELLLLAYDAVTGTLLWEDHFDSGISSMPSQVIAGVNRVFVVGRAENMLGRIDFIIRAHDSRTGQLVWLDQSESWWFPAAAALDGAQVFVTGIGDLVGELPRAQVRAYEAR